MTLRRIIPLLCLALLAISAATNAHESRPLYMELTAIEGNGYALEWRYPASLAAINLPSIELPAGCRRAGPQRPPAYQGRALYDCDKPLAGQTLSINYPGANPSVSTMVKYRPAEGGEHIALLGPQQTQWQVPDAETVSGVAQQYTHMGMIHIWKGADHLLFLVCLLWIAGDIKRVVITITGFTLAHSVTLALSALDLLRLPVPPVEAAIALSVVFLAREICVGKRNSLTWNHPIAVSSAFGLLHGLGFAAVLGEIGLPQTQLITGLLFFNIGVEVGQLIFIAGVWLLMYLLRLHTQGSTRLVATQPDGNGRMQTAAAYSVGILASFWVIERMAGF